MIEFSPSTSATPVIRLEREADIEEIRDVHQRAFPSPVEADLVDRLRTDGDLSLSVVAAEHGLIGHLAFSRIAIESAPEVRAFALGPIGVIPERQSQGIGSAMIGYGLERLGKSGADLVLVLGEPRYYERFGFQAERAEGLATPWSGPNLLGLALNDALPAFDGATARYAAAFSAFG